MQELSGDASSKQIGFLWEKVTDLSSAGIVKIVDFAKKIPGFLSLPSSDQITLLKAACLEIMVGAVSTTLKSKISIVRFIVGFFVFVLYFRFVFYFLM